MISPVSFKASVICLILSLVPFVVVGSINGILPCSCNALILAFNSVTSIPKSLNILDSSLN